MHLLFQCCICSLKISSKMSIKHVKLADVVLESNVLLREYDYNCISKVHFFTRLTSPERYAYERTVSCYAMCHYTTQNQQHTTGMMWWADWTKQHASKLAPTQWHPRIQHIQLLFIALHAIPGRRTSFFHTGSTKTVGVKRFASVASQFWVWHHRLAGNYLKRGRSYTISVN